MTDRGDKLPGHMEHIANLCLYLAETSHDQVRRTGEGSASSSHLGRAPAKDKKMPKKKKKESNKELAALKKKAAQERAERLKTVRDLKKNQLLESIKKHKEVIERRRLLIQINMEKLKMLNAKKNKNTKRDK